LNHFDIKKPLTSYHEHNVKEKGPILIDKIINGESIALVSDAGMPGISDPGEDLIRLAIENNIDVTALPGPTASILALVLSGLPTGKFIFEGFLPSNKKERRERLEKLKAEERTMILYESPHRIKALLEDMKEALGERELAVARELTKKYEEIVRGTVSECLDRFNKGDVKGEFVIIVKGNSQLGLEEENEYLWNDMSVKEHILLYITQGLDKKEAVKRVAVERNIPKRDVYKESILI